MTTFRTKITPEKSVITMDLNNPIYCMGSCFAETIGKRLAGNKFNVSVNPFGIIFNPLSIFRLIEDSIKQKQPDSSTFLERDDRFYSYLMHSEISSNDKNSLTKKISEIQKDTFQFIKKAKYLILTFGTAFIYEKIEGNMLVANCHKIPPQHFKKRLLTSHEIVSGFHYLKELLFDVNPTLNVILTVSPIRHIKDTLPLNAVSKSVLRLAVHELSQNQSNVHYFPSYELLLDDLRDYRFYANDMLHPSETAQEYIWDRFCSTYCNDRTLAFMKDWKNLEQALAHKPFNSSSNQHKQFLKNTLEKLEKLKSKVNLSQEIKQIQAQL